MEAVDDAPEQRLALVGHLSAVHGDAVDHDADGLAERAGGVVFVPDLPAVDLAPLGRSAVECDVLADGGGL